MKKKGFFSLAIFVICAGLILFLGVQNGIYPTLSRHSDFREKYNEQFAYKNILLEISGAVHKAMGVRELNRVVNLDTVSYVDTIPEVKNLPAKVESIEKLNNMVENFAFIYLPSLMRSDANKIMPYQYPKKNEIAASFFQQLQEKGIPAYDFALYDTDLPIEQRYFKTDHHWLPQFAFRFAKPISQIIADRLGMELNESLYNIDNFNIKILPKFFLGYNGKRVGRAFVGLDDIAVIAPKFDTSYTLHSYHGNKEVTGDFAKVFLREDFYPRPNYYEENPYNIYIGHDTSHMHLLNHTAKNDKRIMLLVDSYSQVLIPFMAGGFSELYVYDLRYFTGPISEEIARLRPDMLLMQYSHYALEFPQCFEIR